MTHLGFFSTVAKETAEDERQAIACELEEAKKKIHADELTRIDFEFKFNAQNEEIAKLKTRLETQGKQFEQNIREVCDARIQLEETVKSREEHIKTLEEELSGLKQQAEVWFIDAKRVNDLLLSKFIY